MFYLKTQKTTEVSKGGGWGNSPHSSSLGSAFLVLFALLPSVLGLMLRLDAVDEKVARVSELCVKINKIWDQQRKELATFKEQVTSNLTCTILQFVKPYGARRCACPSATTAFWEVDRVCASGWRTTLHVHIATLMMQPLWLCGDWMNLLIW